MISYAPFWETIKKKNISTYSLIQKHKISKGTFYRMNKGEWLSTKTINSLCYAVKCRVEEIMEYIEDEPDKENIESLLN